MSSELNSLLNLADDLLILKNSKIKAWRLSFNSLSPFSAILIRLFARKYSRRVGRMSVLDGSLDHPTPIFLCHQH